MLGDMSVMVIFEWENFLNSSAVSRPVPQPISRIELGAGGGMMDARDFAT